MLNKNINDEGESSSSADEISRDALKEATDHEFLKDTYFSTMKSNDSKNSEDKTRNSAYVENIIKPKSLRQDLKQKECFDNFGVSPSFQNYVAKKLDEIIEKSVKLKSRKHNSFTNNEGNVDNSGIKLLSSSADFLTAEEEIEKPQKRRRTEVAIDEKATLLKCKEVAVDPEKILSKTDTKAWTSKRKEPEFKYKRLKNGTLVEQT
ncbi:PREDICTED: uncharacterized protein LOC107185931 [Dufourea novaeangliae]|uniref:Protein CUSTOS n=1 Tax=Dufourea novaeangliae TaxID=178035 RepID=A0A154P713_DUFNO|nr:PREDICTED: uncharacterized protein LOC107185931 [Dufourea novaeangliae]KZC07725.1 hypothetical protein WN55_08046 [Dufourea novaeangliae]